LFLRGCDFRRLRDILLEEPSKESQNSRGTIFKKESSAKFLKGFRKLALLVRHAVKVLHKNRRHYNKLPLKKICKKGVQRFLPPSS
jgi:hypothetical protein